MSDGIIIESISNEAFEQIEAFKDKLLEGMQATTAWTKELAKVRLPSELKRQYTETTTAIGKTKKVVSDYEKQVRKLENAQKKRMQTSSTVNKQTIKLNVETTKLNRLQRLQARLTSSLSGVYDKLDAKLSVTANEYRNLAVRKEIGLTLTDKEERRMALLERRIIKYDAVLKKVDATMGRNQRNVGKYKSGFDGLGFSVAQLSREMPAFANSMQTGFMAISNNIPMFVDEITKLKKANIELQATGKPTVNILKTVGKAILSMNGLLGIGITILTVFGPKLIEWAFGMTKAEKATEKANEAIEEQNKQLRENLRLRKLQLKDLKGFIDAQNEVLKNILFENTGSDVEKQGLLLIEISERLAELGIENADSIKDENITQQDRVFIAANLLEIEKQKIKLQEERMRLQTISTKRVEIEAEFEKGAITLTEKRFKLNNLNSGSLKETLSIQGRIKQLQEEVNRLIGNQVILDGDKNKKSLEGIKGSILHYEKLIQKLTELRDAQALTNEQYEEFNRQIGLLRHNIDLLNGSYALYLRLTLSEGAILQTKDDIVKALKVEGDELERQNELMQKQAALRLKKQQQIETERELIKDAFVSLGETLGIQGKTIADLFDSMVFGFANAGEAAQQFGALFGEILTGMAAAENQRIDRRIEQLEQEKEIQLAFAGESAEGRGRIEERYNEEIARQKTKQAQNTKRAAVVNSVINTAAAVVKTFAELGFPAGIPAAAVVGALGLAQTAIIASQPIPEFEKGVRNFRGGPAVINEKRNEVVTTKDGQIMRPTGRNLLVNLPEGSNVYRDEKAFEAEMNRNLTINGINPIGSSMVGNIPTAPKRNNNGISEDAMRRALKDTLGGMTRQTTIVNENGVLTYAQTQHNKAIQVNNRVTQTGIDV